MTLIEVLGTSLVHFFWQGGLLLLLAWVLLFALRNRSAQARYLVSATILGLMALAPILTAIVIYPREGLPSTLPTSNLPASIPILREPITAVQEALSPEMLRIVVFGWLIGVGALTVRCLGGFISLARLKRLGCQPVPAAIQTRFVELATKMGVRKLPRLWVSSRVGVPTVLGAFRGVILLPASVVTGMTPAMLETVLAHELAHVVRYDFLVNAVQSAIEIVLFYHPAVWWISNRIREERENCCDDLVLATLNDRQTYALALTRVEELRMNPLALRANGGELIARIRRILGEKQMKSIASPLSIAVLIGTLALVPMLQSYADGATTPQKKQVAAPTKKKVTTKTKQKGRDRIVPGTDIIIAPSAARPATVPPRANVADNAPTPMASPYPAGMIPPQGKAQALPSPSVDRVILPSPNVDLAPLPAANAPSPTVNSPGSIPSSNSIPAMETARSANAPDPIMPPANSAGAPPKISLSDQIKGDITECMTERATLVRQYRDVDLTLVRAKIDLAGALRSLSAATDKERPLAEKRAIEARSLVEDLTESREIFQTHIKQLESELDELRSRLEKIG